MRSTETPGRSLNHTARQTMAGFIFGKQMNPTYIQLQLTHLQDFDDIQRATQRLYLHFAAHGEGHLVPLGTGRRALDWTEGARYTEQEIKAAVSVAHQALAIATNEAIVG